MIDELPTRALFRFELQIPRLAEPLPMDGDVRKWPAECEVPCLAYLEDEEPFADVYWGWHDSGLFFGFDVPYRRSPLRCNPKQWWKQDGLRICVDTRDARENKRGSRYCHFFYVLPRSEDRKSSPVVGLHRMSRAKESPPGIDPSDVQVATRSGRVGYYVEVHIPAGCLYGWDPAEHNRLGVFYKIKDLELGGQTLSTADSLGWNADPSTWSVGVLNKAGT